MLWAAMTQVFLGFLRLGEMTCNSPYSPAMHLSPSDVSLLQIPSVLNICLFELRYLQLADILQRKATNCVLYLIPVI